MRRSLRCLGLRSEFPDFIPSEVPGMLRSRSQRVPRQRILSVLLILVFCIAASRSSAQPISTAARPIVVGYFRGDSMRRQFYLKDLISQGAATILDQINYSQANIANNRCIVADPVADLTYSFSAGDSVDGTADTPAIPLRGNFHQLQELKRLYPHIKVVISLEGNADVFVKAAQPESRVAFVTSCVQQFIQGKIADGIEVPGIFDGIDIDWEYPLEADKLNFTALLAEFRRQLDAIGPNHLLTVAMGSGRNTYQHLDMSAVARYADQVGIMNYDYAGPWSKKTGLVAPLYHAPGDPEVERECRCDNLGLQRRGRATIPDANGTSLLRLLVEERCSGKPWAFSTRRIGP